MANPVITVGQGGSKHKLRRVLMVLGAVVLVAGLAGGAGAGVRWLKTKQEEKRAASPQAISKDVSDAQKQILGDDLDKAHGTINDALDNPGISAQSKHDLYLQQGAIFENEKKYDEAAASYQKALEAKESSQAYESLARLAEQKGDKDLAISYYEKAIPLIPQDDAMKDAIKKYYENKIIVLKGGKPNYE